MGGLEPLWNYAFEIDGIEYNRYNGVHQGQQQICGIKPDLHYPSTCSLCNPNAAGYVEIPSDAFAVKWDKIEPDHILFDGMTQAQKQDFVRLPAPRVSHETVVETPIPTIGEQVVEVVKNYSRIVMNKIRDVMESNG